MPSLASVGGPEQALQFEVRKIRLKATAAVAVGNTVSISNATLLANVPEAAPAVAATVGGGDRPGLVAVALEAAAIGGFFDAVFEGAVTANASGTAVTAGDYLTVIADGALGTAVAANNDNVVGLALSDEASDQIVAWMYGMPTGSLSD
jgi:hypothetical protein